MFKVFVIAWLIFCSALTLAKNHRSAAERMAFIRENPCPETGQRRGACPGWEVDHIQALCAGGADHRSNMQWLTVAEHRAKTRQDVRICRVLRLQPS